MVFIRPENFAVAETGAGGDNHIAATIANEEFEGQSYHVFLKGAGDSRIKMSLANTGRERAASAIGAQVTLSYDPDQAVALPSGEMAEEE